jgi:O-antigen ligase
VASFFSASGGLWEVGEFINFFKFFFLPLALMIFVRSQKSTEWLLGAALLSSVTVIIYGFSHAEQRVFEGFHGYFPFVRTSYMLVIVVLACIVFLDDKYFRQRQPKLSILLAVLIPLLVFAISMASIRGAWLGFVLGIFGYTLFFSRKMTVPITIGFLGFLVLSDSNAMMEQVKSIVDFENNISNNSRLHLWKAGLDFSKTNFWFGVGEQGLEQRFSEFFTAQSSAYQKSYQLALNYPDNFHNSYLQILIQWGALTSAALVLSFSTLIYKFIKALRFVAPEKAVYIRAFLVVTAGFLVSQFFHGDLYSYGATVYFLLMFSTIQIIASSDKV